MRHSTSTSILLMACTVLVSSLGGLAVAQENNNATIQIGHVNINRTSQCGELNTNTTYQQGHVNINQTGQGCGRERNPNRQAQAGHAKHADAGRGRSTSAPGLQR